MRLSRQNFGAQWFVVTTTSCFIAFTFFFATTPAQAASVNPAISAPTACPATAGLGSSGIWVQALQYRLNTIAPIFIGSSAHLATDGQFGPATQSLVGTFQNAYGSPINNPNIHGVVESDTWSALGMCAQGTVYPAAGVFGGPVFSCPPTLSLGSSGTWVSVLQHMLNARAAFGNFSLSQALATDGQFGTKTYDAVRAYQSANEVHVDGQVGPNSWAGLGMC